MIRDYGQGYAHRESWKNLIQEAKKINNYLHDELRLPRAILSDTSSQLLKRIEAVLMRRQKSSTSDVDCMLT